MKLNEIPQNRTILVMGNSGTGKTTLCGTLAQIVPTVIVTADRKELETLRKLP
jgi:energy-coupling factor transporter ATP-binding protein EcfA2